MRTTITLFLLSLSIFSYGQYLQIGVQGGISNYFGDVSDQNIYIEASKPTVGINMSYAVSKIYNIGWFANYATITGSDSYHKKQYLVERNLSFKTNIIEIGLQNEINLIQIDYDNKKTSAPYLFFGLAAFHFNPMAKMDGEWVDLQPLGTEGQGNLNAGSKPYSKINLAVPLGFGFKFAVKRKFRIALEFGIRKTLTDYLDDVSGTYPLVSAMDPEVAKFTYRTPEYFNLPISDMPDPIGRMRGNPDNQDWYMLFNLKLNYVLSSRDKIEWEKKYRIFYGNEK